MFVKTNWVQLAILVICTLLIANLSSAGPDHTQFAIDAIKMVDKNSSQSDAKIRACPPSVRSSDVKGGLRNCAHGINAEATVSIGSRTVVHGREINEK